MYTLCASCGMYQIYIRMELYMKSCGVESSLFSGMPAAGHSDFCMIISPKTAVDSLYKPRSFTAMVEV